MEEFLTLKKILQLFFFLKIICVMVGNVRQMLGVISERKRGTRVSMGKGEILLIKAVTGTVCVP